MTGGSFFIMTFYNECADCIFMLHFLSKRYSSSIRSDFLYPDKRVIFEGSLQEFVRAEEKLQVMAGEAQDKDMGQLLRGLYGAGASERAVAYGS